jgi:hypothetical protein
MSPKIKKYFGLDVKCPIFLPDFNQILISFTDFPNRKFQANPSSGRPRRYMRRHGLT